MSCRFILIATLALAGCGSQPQSQPSALMASATPTATPAPTPIDPVEAALRAATTSDAERAFYDRVGWRPVWTDREAAALRRAIAARRAHALDHKHFDTGEAADGATREQIDAIRTRAALRYAAALARGAVDPLSVHTIYTLPRPAPDLAGGLADALGAGDLTGWLDTLAPQSDAYRALAQAYRDEGIADDVPAAHRLPRRTAIAVAMERLRWLEREPPQTRIDVNIAAARLTYWRDGAITDQRNVVVGSPRTKTPQLGSPIFRLVANPTWTIPASIVRHDNMGARSAVSLARSGMRRVNGRIVQAAGPRNALGIVKFDMRNPHAIYLHDTPAKGLFAATDRHRSHGCVRVEDARGLAAIIAADGGIEDRFAAALASSRTAGVPLPHEVPVRLLYATVLLDEGGGPVQIDDPYGWDAPVAARLGMAAAEKPKPQAAPIDTGP